MCHGCNLYDQEKEGCQAQYDETKECNDGSNYRPIDNRQKSFKSCPECHCVHGKYPALSTVLSLLDFHKPTCRMAAQNWVKWALRNVTNKCKNCKLDDDRKYPMGECNPFASCGGPMRKATCPDCRTFKTVNIDGICEDCWDDDYRDTPTQVLK